LPDVNGKFCGIASLRRSSGKDRFWPNPEVYVQVHPINSMYGLEIGWTVRVDPKWKFRLLE